jgi:hypothetical protein
MKLPVKRLYLLLALAILALGQQEARAAQATAAAPAKAAPKEVQLSGKVVETMDGGGYTYVLLQNGAEKVWVAIPLMKVTVGQQLNLVPGYEMKNFSSKALNRKFDRVVFSAGVANSEVKLSPAAIKMAHEGVPAQGGTAGGAAAAAKPAAASHPSAAKPAAVAGTPKATPLSIVQVAKAKGPNAYTIAQLYAKKDKLEKKPVVVRGKIVKVSPRILKRNWIHIQDGSGTEAKKNNNLIVTSKDLPRMGEVVTVRGTLYNNMDFGSGYRYGLLVEGAKFKK